MMKEDLLYQILQECIDTATDPMESHDTLVKKVTANYMRHLLAEGHIPHVMIQVVIDDIETEVLEMYRKKTYGSYDLKSYRNGDFRIRQKYSGPKPSRSGRKI